MVTIVVYYPGYILGMLRIIIRLHVLKVYRIGSDSMRLILQYFREAISKFTKYFLAALGAITLLTLSEALIPWGFRLFLDEVTTKGDFNILIVGIILFALFLLLQIFINIVRFTTLDRFGGRFIEHLSLLLERSMAETTYSEIEKLQPGVIHNILYTDVLNIFRTIGHCIPSMLGAFTVVCVTLCIGFHYDAGISLFVFAAVAVGLLLSWSSRKILAKYAGQTNAKLKIHDMWCTQFVEMLPQIQSEGISSYYQENTRQNLRDFIGTSIREDKIIYFWTGLIRSYHTLFSLALSALLAVPAAGGSVPNLVFFTLIANLTMEQTQVLESMFQQCMRNYVSFQHVETLRMLPVRAGTKEADTIRSIDFENVSFTYPNGVQVLHNRNCHLETGDFVHLKGENGSGKSTFIKLLSGLYTATEGKILLNGIPIDQFSPESKRQKILYISQDEKLLNETFHRHLEIMTGKAISQTEYHYLLELLKLPDDEREISGNGSSLSVGQRKKLSIIKMLLRQETAAVIILDEVAAGLDAETTSFFYETIQQLANEQNKIILLIDHILPDTVSVTKRISF